jgi:hypothetical protein
MAAIHMALAELTVLEHGAPRPAFVLEFVGRQCRGRPAHNENERQRDCRKAILPCSVLGNK